MHIPYKHTYAVRGPFWLVPAIVMYVIAALFCIKQISMCSFILIEQVLTIKHTESLPFCYQNISPREPDRLLAEIINHFLLY